mmetsp:Transcript_25695/g.35899  ORF Transcript_25695/g.35899 Transcript_25695/m.35899 type:complete len:99 (+) Transcript_25695:386-682(+)
MANAFGTGRWKVNSNEEMWSICLLAMDDQKRSDSRSHFECNILSKHISSKRRVGRSYGKEIHSTRRPQMLETIFCGYLFDSSIRTTSRSSSISLGVIA